MLIEPGDIYINKISRIDIFVGDDHTQGVFSFLIKILYIMNTGKIYEILPPVGYIWYKKDNGVILNITIIEDLLDYINSLKEFTIFNNQHMSPSNIYLIGDLAF